MANRQIHQTVKAYALNPAIKHSAPVVKGVVRPAAPPVVKGVTRPPIAPAAPTSAPGGMPWDAHYEDAVGGINANRDTALAGIAHDEMGVKQQYGFDDLSDPFSKIQLLKRTFADSQRGNTNSMAAAGHLYSGALDNAQAETQHGYDASYDATRREYDSLLEGLQTRRTGVQHDATDQTAAADWDRVQSGLANRPDPASLPAAKPVSVVGKPAYTSKPGKDSKGNPGVWHTYSDGRKPVFVRA